MPPGRSSTEPAEHDVPGYGQVRDHLGDEDRVEAPIERRVLDGEVPLEGVDAACAQTGEAGVVDVGDAATVVP